MIVLLSPADCYQAKIPLAESTYQQYVSLSAGGYTGGPTVVAENLLREFNMRTDIDWALVTPEFQPDREYTVMWVVNGLPDLAWAIQNKAELGVKELWAGPNLVVVPQEGLGIIGHPFIDKIIVPCRWPGEVYAQLMPHIAAKIVIWAVGIDAEWWSPVESTERSKIIIYDKNNTVLADELTQGLELAEESVTRVTYGSYQLQEYKALLQQAKAIVWLSPTESQGIALLEAFAMNVPALCWHNTKWSYVSGELHAVVDYDGAISAPYFGETCGVFFENTVDFFMSSYPAFIQKLHSFRPREFLFTHNLVVGQALNPVIQELYRICAM